MLRRIGHVFVLLAFVLLCLTINSMIRYGTGAAAGAVFIGVCLAIAYILGAFKSNASRLP